MTEPAHSGILQVEEFDEHDALGQADWIIGGEEARKARKQGLYAAYLLALFAGIYGFPIIQAVFKTSDQTWLREQLASPGGIAALVVAIGAIIGAAFWAGRYRGPVVPPLPWIDLVLSAPIDRALAVKRWWRYALFGSAFTGAVVGFVMGAGLAYAEVTGVLAMVTALIIGLIVGLITARVWLWAQVRSWPDSVWGQRGPRLLVRPNEALRQLHSESLRVHAANTSTLSGSIHAGNLRTARLALARPVRHGRRLRLKAGSRFGVIVRRDILGLRRSPASLGAGFGFVTLGFALAIWVLVQPAAPPVASAIGLLPLYLGFGALAEGLRLQADNIGTPTLIGAPPLLEAGAHMVTPAAATATVGALGLGVAAALGATVTPTVVLALVLLVVLLCGGHLLASFRGSPVSLTNPQTIMAWYAMPSLIVIGVGALTVWAGGHRHDLLPMATILVAGVLAWGIWRIRHLTYLHID